MYERKIGKGIYRLGRILETYPDAHDRVRTVKVGLRKRDSRETSLPYVGKPLEEVILGIQRIAVICPVEEQIDEAEVGGGDENNGLEVNG